MGWFGEIWRRLKFFINRQQFERDLEEEIQLHKELRQQDYRRAGIDYDSARHKAQRRFGNDMSLKEVSREMWGWGSLEKLARELRYALRTLNRSPRFTIVSVLTLALGIGAATATFSLFDSIVLRPLGYRNPEKLYGIYFYLPRLAQQFPRLFVNGHNVVAWREQSKAFSELTAFVYREWTLIGAGEPERLHGCRTTVNFFSVLGVRPILGRDFRPDEDVNGHEHVVLINEGFWRRRFGADPAILGKKMNLDGRLYEVIGVIPAGFAFPHTLTLEAFGGRDRRVDFWKPMAFDTWETDPPFGPMEFEAIARLAPGYTPEQGRDELNRISNAISQGDPNASEIQIRIAPLKDNIIGSARQTLMVLLGAVGFVLLIVCVNLANLMLARDAGRHRELAVRAALGASLSQLARQSIAESLALSAAGGVLGWGLAFLLVEYVTKVARVQLPRLAEVNVDHRVLLFAAAISLLSGIVCALLPAVRAARVDPQISLQAGGRGMTEARSTRVVRATLVTCEVALSVVLLIGAGLLLRSFSRLMAIDHGFQAANVLTVDLNFSGLKYGHMFDRQLVENLESTPGISAAGVVSLLPVTNESDMVGILPREAPDNIPVIQRPHANIRGASSGYFNALHISVIAGRLFEDADRGRNVVLVSQKLANSLWPKDSPIGREIKIPDSREMGGRVFEEITSHFRIYRVIGIVADVPASSLERGPFAILYYPFWQESLRAFSLVVRTGVDPRSAALPIRNTIRQLAPDIPLGEFRTMERVISDSVDQRRFQMTLLLGFALTALLLACLGIYGVVAYGVSRRTNEIGIRVALGATATQVRSLILRQGLVPVAFGLLIGVGASLLMARLISAVLFGVQPFDPLTYTAVIVTLAAAAVTASYTPAWRATRIDPATALRYE